MTEKRNIALQYSPPVAKRYRQASHILQAPDYARIFFQSVLSRIPAKNKHLLDLGCGAGDDLNRYGRSSWHSLYGLEPSAAFRQQARNLMKRRAIILGGHCENIPLPNKSVDVVTARYVLHYTDSVADALIEIARILKPGGWLIASISHPDLDVKLPRNTDGRTITFQILYGAVTVTFPVHQREDYFGATCRQYFHKPYAIGEAHGSDQLRGTPDQPNILCFAMQRKFGALKPRR